MKDDLSSSVGAVMDLLGSSLPLITYDTYVHDRTARHLRASDYDPGE